MGIILVCVNFDISNNTSIVFTNDMSDSDVKNSELILKEYDLEELKNFFKEEINSVRRLDEISSLEVLLDVLRDRNALTSDIFKKLGPDFQRLVNSNSEEPDSQKVYLPPKGLFIYLFLFETSQNSR